MKPARWLRRLEVQAAGIVDQRRQFEDDRKHRDLDDRHVGQLGLVADEKRRHEQKERDDADTR